MKYKITEEQLSKIIAESTNKILAESLETEGWWSNFKQGLRDFDYNFRRGLKGQGYDGNEYRRLDVQTGNNGGNVNTGQTQTLEKLQTEINQIKQQISAMEGGSTQQQPQATQQQQPQNTPQQTQDTTQQPQKPVQKRTTTRKPRQVKK